jgi:hypothetical protein
MKPAAADVLQRDEGDEEDGADDRDRRVLPAEVGRRALLDRGREAAHDLVAGRQGQERSARDHAVPDGRQRADERDDDPVVGQEIGQGRPLRKRSDKHESGGRRRAAARAVAQFIGR